ncbi:Ger(x)C family spore germination protein [Cohnella cholangitidis]|uniref:Ger(X)C family spore germination protein n=1 Tax=Cohnella cholangitidis TaxID=2598458 RepID=A0A7G5C7I7_9BACL|nr:Ger(x)C family spore germination protein [Cohnella cholangitidis]
MVATTLLLSTGCWDRKEVNDLAIVTFAGLDRKDDGEIELTLEIVMPKKGGKEKQQSKGSSPTLIWSASGLTAADAASKLQLKLPRAIYWGQLELLVIGEALSRGQFREQMDYLVRDNNIRLRVQPFVCRGVVREFLASSSPLEQTKADFLSGESAHAIRQPITLNRLVQNLGNKSEASILPYVDITQDGNESIPYVKGYAIFSHDRMAGVIKGESFFGMKWMLHQVKGDTETVKLEEPSTSLISLGVLSSRTRIVPGFEEGMPRIEVGIETELRVVQNTTRFAATDPKFIHGVEKAATDHIRHKVEKTIKQAQRMGSDIFGFGDAINRRHPRQWQRLQARWERIFPSLQVKVKVLVKVRNTGMNNLPAGEPREEV